MKSGENIEKLRHSLSHLLAAAVLSFDKNALPTLGPAIENGFYYDFELNTPIGNDDLPKIEEKMREFLPTWEVFEKIEVTPDEAREIFSQNPYKIELINEHSKAGENITIFYSGPKNSIPSKEFLLKAGGYILKSGFIDLCRGGHIENIGKINPNVFKLTHIAGAYWRGNEKNKMLTRIYGLAFETKKELDKYLAQQEEADKRDHRKVGKDMGLFVFSDLVGKGLPLWTEKGATIRRELERFIVDEEIKRGYKHVYSPDIANLNLYKKSGHYPYYKDSMYAPIKIDDEEFMLRPMTCPHHFELYLSKPRSYKELPMRIAEMAKLYRYEQSGELSGLMRVRSFCLSDAHIICKDSTQAAEEVNGALDLIEYITDVLGLKKGEDYSYRLSLGDRGNEEKYYKNDASWDEAEDKLRNVLKKRKTDFIEAPGEAAFYGPKIDIQMKNIRGKEETAFTVQYDFVMPERFDLNFTDKDGKEKRAIVIHRSSIGAIERIIAFLIEKYGGVFPLWLSPVQVKIIPISELHLNYANKIFEHLKNEGIRVEVDENNETLGKKIRNWKLEKTPYAVIIGDKEVEVDKITLESRNDGNVGQITPNELLSKLLDEIKNKK
ncbi:MAG: threonine--tRNA ligase [Candidatus Zambryskibacteria bacterium CG_4_9_14_3_um_filter_40_16]|uniref:Threonine--tRNA ligase n=2 Tax=Candidatus Zambryskiibacteriota TaxID=1817925 RepID=A0A2H0K914_9BACT|nr:MAG: threonine--tRNA ligase [Candidatus Zambryskibacteria bacterium CG11_big_fil_rev_8_21_14_0_20_40_24]PJA33918.1 MAG: threonine--tRNA ligase [Candidatus Zambryskibacteria bacterium CG_4_9_14_3_um_filter_40_16]